MARPISSSIMMSRRMVISETPNIGASVSMDMRPSRASLSKSVFCRLFIVLNINTKRKKSSLGVVKKHSNFRFGSYSFLQSCQQESLKLLGVTPKRRLKTWQKWLGSLNRRCMLIASTLWLVSIRSLSASSSLKRKMHSAGVSSKLSAQCL